MLSCMSNVQFQIHNLVLVIISNSSFRYIRKAEYFEKRHPKEFGTLESVQLLKEEKRKDEEGNKLEENTGFGFVMVSSEDMADKMAIQHASFEFGGRKIELKKPLPPR